jgi:hypothetical protein
MKGALIWTDVFCCVAFHFVEFCFVAFCFVPRTGHYILQKMGLIGMPWHPILTWAMYWARWNKSQIWVGPGLIILNIIFGRKVFAHFFHNRVLQTNPHVTKALPKIFFTFYVTNCLNPEMGHVLVLL